MPIYEYQCEACDHVFDVLQKLSDEPLTYCPDCAEPKLKKLVSAPSFRLKGGGWYETDFKKDNRRNIAGDSGDSKSTSSEKKGDDVKSKPPAKPAADTKGNAKSGAAKAASSGGSSAKAGS